MANIAKRPDGRWRARYRDATGREHSRHFDRKTDGQRWLDEIASSKLSGAWADPSKAKIRFGDWSTAWLAAQLQLTTSTRVRYEQLLRVHILPVWSKAKLVDITHSDVSKWVQTLVAGGSSASTIRQTHRVFSMIMGHAVRDGRISRNPAVGVPLPREQRVEKVFLTHKQVVDLASAAGAVRGRASDGLIIRTLAFTGLRWGELAALRVRRLDIVRRRLEIAESVTEVGGHETWGSTKTHATRMVAIPKSLLEELEKQTYGKGPNDLVFAAPKGGTLLLRNWRRTIFEPAVGATGLTGFTVHGLRHTAASLAASAGAGVRHVQAMLGHSSPVMTLSVYSHLFDDDLDAVADRLDAAAAAARADWVRTDHEDGLPEAG